MIDRKPSISWQAVVQGVAVIYGVSVAAGFALDLNDITQQSDPTLYPFLALVSEAIGVAIALRVAQTTGLSYLAGIGMGFWLASGISVYLGAQTLTSWVESSALVAASVLLGRLLVGTSVDISQPPVLSYSTLVEKKIYSATRERHVRQSLF